MKKLPISKSTSSTIASNGYILANDLALLPFMIWRECFRDGELRWALISIDGTAISANFYMVLSYKIHLFTILLYHYCYKIIFN